MRCGRLVGGQREDRCVGDCMEEGEEGIWVFNRYGFSREQKG